jgi:hypothetical protein
MNCIIGKCPFPTQNSTASNTPKSTLFFLKEKSSFLPPLFLSTLIYNHAPIPYPKLPNSHSSHSPNIFFFSFSPNLFNISYKLASFYPIHYTHNSNRYFPLNLIS